MALSELCPGMTAGWQLSVAPTRARLGRAGTTAFTTYPRCRHIWTWGGFVRQGPSWRMWAFPTSEAVELWVSLADGAELGKVQAELGSNGWTLSQPPKETPVLVRSAPDGSLTAIFMWEKSEVD